MVYFLVKFHSKKCIGVDFAIGPPDIPITAAGVLLYDPPEFFSYFFEDGILSVRDIDDYLFGFGLIS